MTRDEQIKKLGSIKLIITNLTATYDMGLEFSILTNLGGDVNLGNISNWPISKIKVTEEMQAVHAKLLNGNKVTFQEVFCIKEFSSILSYHSTPWSEEHSASEQEKYEAFENICEALKSLTLNNEYIYSFTTLEDWDRQIRFFDTYDSLEDFLIEEWGDAVQPYDEMTSEQLQYYFNCARDENWENTMPIFSSEEEE